ncbi:MAG: AAA family ATPase, partial [Candidatus Heimdallarchaeota archaeon]|nr:AAA family ATPase [Candidatus Heimdallarchaeota archaeon]MCK4955431.1 AAA family ATPase [Candidatus Heimdallarchaeota archaeon]
MTSLIHENYIFHRLILYNFKMHKSTELNFSDVPIIVLSGANGSGKTQILEALILAIGHTPSRVSLSNFKELVGPFDDYCKIDLTLFNPDFSDQRVISSSDPDISGFVDSEYFSIEVHINQAGNVKRKIKNEEGKKKDITKKQIQRLMKSIGIYEDTMLNFTEEGYLSSFADGSPHKKLDSLLVATGLNEVFTTYLNSKKRVEEKEHEYSPLAMQLEKEEIKLHRLRENFERLQKKKELIQRFGIVEKELAYFNANNSQEEFEKVSKELNEKKQEFEKLKENERIKQNNYDTLQIEMKRQDAELSNNRIKIQEMSDKKNRLEGQRDERIRHSSVLETTIEKTEYEIKNFTNLNASENLTKKIQLQNKLTEIKRQHNLVLRKSENIVSELRRKKEEEELIKERISERSQIYGELSEYERKLIKDSISFKEKILLSNNKDEIIGPLYEVISVNRKYKNFSNVIKSALGRYLFSFVATSHTAYEEAKSIYDELFPSYKPNFTVGRILEEEKGPKPDYLTRQKLENKPEGILDFVVNLIDAPMQVKIYLNKFVKIILASPDLSPNILTDFAKKFRTNILTTDGKSFYLSQEAFTRPPSIYNVILGVEASKYQSMERIRDQLNKLHKEMEDLSLEASQYTK